MHLVESYYTQNRRYEGLGQWEWLAPIGTGIQTIGTTIGTGISWITQHILPQAVTTGAALTPALIAHQEAKKQVRFQEEIARRAEAREQARFEQEQAMAAGLAQQQQPLFAPPLTTVVRPTAPGGTAQSLQAGASIGGISATPLIIGGAVLVAFMLMRRD